MARRGHSASSACDVCSETSSFVLAEEENEVKGWAGGLVLTRLGWSSSGSLLWQVYLDSGMLDRLSPHRLRYSGMSSTSPISEVGSQVSSYCQCGCLSLLRF